MIKEAFMYRHSLMFKKSLSFFKNNLKDIKCEIVILSFLQLLKIHLETKLILNHHVCMILVVIYSITFYLLIWL